MVPAPSQFIGGMPSPVRPTFTDPQSAGGLSLNLDRLPDVWRSIDGGAFSVQGGAVGHSALLKPAVANRRGYLDDGWLVGHDIGLSQSTGIFHPGLLWFGVIKLQYIGMSHTPLPTFQVWPDEPTIFRQKRMTILRTNE